MEKLKPIHPGIILLEEFLKPFGISQYRLAKDINVPHDVSMKSSMETEQSHRILLYDYQNILVCQNDFG